MKTKTHSRSGFLDSRALVSLAMVITGIYLTVFATAKPQALTSGPARHFGAPVARGNGPPRPPLGSVQEAWVVRYNGPGNGEDDATAIAIDGKGNVYVTGTSQGSGTGYDFATIKYDSNGQKQWVARYNGPANLDDSAKAAVVDGAGNVYVTGSSTGAGSGLDCVTVKYDSAGQQQWVARDAGFHLGSEAHAITVDASGNIYVTGGSGFIDSGLDYLTIKYNSAGQKLWGRRYSGGYAFGEDIATAIAVDGLGNVYVTGTSFVPATGFDYATVKYDSSGGDGWSVRYNGPANGEDDASSIAIDNSGNIYVTGQSAGSGTGPDYATIKYEASGNQLWVARYNGPENGDAYDSAAAVAVDGAGNADVN